MNRQQKEALINVLKKGFTGSEAAYLVGYHGLSVNLMQDLRGKLRDKGAQLKIAKMRLIKRAIDEGSLLKDFLPHLQKQRGIVFVSQEPAAVAKVLNDFAKANEQLDLVFGYVEREFLDREAIKYLATLPSREVLLAQVVGTMQAPITQFAVVLNMFVVRLLFVLKQVAEKKEKEA